jgi:tRNA U54 and U55 pseudouridine synthase Pus10
VSVPAPDCIETAWLALSLGALSALGEGQEFVAERKSPRRRVVDLARETKLGSQVLLAFNDHEVVQLLRAAIARVRKVKRLMRGVTVLSALASI